jgi:hypothetical protein
VHRSGLTRIWTPGTRAYLRASSLDRLAADRPMNAMGSLTMEISYLRPITGGPDLVILMMRTYICLTIDGPYHRNEQPTCSWDVGGRHDLSFLFQIDQW